MRQLPELFDLRVKARSLAYLFAAGALMAVLTLVLPHDRAVMGEELGAVGAAALVVAIGVYLLAARVRRVHLHLLLAVGTAMIGLSNYYTGTTALYPLVFSWAVLYAFYFLRLREALAHVALVAITYVVVIAVQDPASPAVRWLLAVGTPVTAGLLISRMLERLRRETMHAEERERTLRQNEARTRLVLDSAPDAFITVDRDGIIRGWNVAAEQVFGWSASEAIGTTMKVLVVPPEFRARHDERRMALLDTDTASASVTYEVELQRRDGTRFPAEAKVSKVTVRDEVFAAGFVRDISERLRREEEREILVREQAARAEAERVAEMVSGMQLLVDAALAHRTLDDIISDLVVRVRGVLDAAAASIFLVEESGLVLRATSGDLPEGEDASTPGNPFAERVASVREPILVSDPEPEELPHLGLDGLAVDSMIGVPLLAEGEVTGVLVVCASTPRHFDSEDLGLLRLAADRVALAIDHARVYEREHRIAETLQRSLLPDRLPQLPGLSVAARYLPAASEAEVGGDWYDVLPIPGGGVGLVMGDVAGKGLAAASMVGRLRSALRAYALEGHSPARVVEQLNRLTWTEGDDSQMTTLLYVVVDAAESTVRWVNAGHLPPLLVVGDRMPHFLEGGGSVPLGVLPFPAFQEVSVKMEPGATVVLFTDGLVELPGTHIDLGMAKLAEVVRNAPTDPEELCDHVLLSLVPAGGATDDVALLALRSIPMVDRFEMNFPTVPESLASMRGLLRRWLRHAESSDKETAEIITACGEAATNTIEHAGGTGATPFAISGRLKGHEVEITVRDHGEWRAPREGDHGRGISLMEALMDSVEVTPTPEGTTVRMTRSLLRAQGNGERL